MGFYENSKVILAIVVSKMAGTFKSSYRPGPRERTLVPLLGTVMLFFILNVCVFWRSFDHIVKYGKYGVPEGTSLPRVLSEIDDEFIRATELSPVPNPHRFRFITSLEDKCKGKNVFLVVIVTSAPSHVKHRNAIRRTWGNETMFPGGNVKVLFALGHSENAHLENAVQRESQLCGDIIQEDFRDSYRNMTTKTVMILRWTVTFCSGAKYVMKTDDDMFVNIETLLSQLRLLEVEGNSGLFMGSIQTGVHPVRTPSSHRYYVSKDDFNAETYPDYLSGTGYVMSMDSVRRLYVTALMTSPMPMEDVYMGICAEKAGIAPRDHSGFTWFRFGFTVCTHRKIITSHNYTPRELLNMWAALQDSSECGLLRTYFSTLYAKTVKLLSILVPCLVLDCGAIEEYAQ